MLRRVEVGSGLFCDRSAGSGDERADTLSGDEVCSAFEALLKVHFNFFTGLKKGLRLKELIKRDFFEIGRAHV